MPIIDNSTLQLLRYSEKHRKTNIVLTVNNKAVIIFDKASPINSYVLEIHNYPEIHKIKLVKVINSLTNVNIKQILLELNNLPLRIKNIHYDDIPKIDQLLDLLNVEYIII